MCIEGAFERGSSVRIGLFGVLTGFFEWFSRSFLCALQRVVVRCCMLQYIAVYCSVLQCVAMCCSVLQRVAACCSVLL